MTTVRFPHRKAQSFEDDTTSEASPMKSRFGLLRWSEIEFQVADDTFVKGLLPYGAMSIVFGESGSGKTHLVNDLSMHVALGWPWFGRKVAQGAVVYIAAEGAGSMKRRIAAFREHHMLGRDDSVPFILVPSPVNLLDPTVDVVDLIADIKRAVLLTGHRLLLIVVDTLSRALAGGNENAPDDMGAFVMNVDRLRAETGAHVAVVHHSGKNSTQGARGHSLLRAAADTEIEVTSIDQGSRRTAKVTKQRDGETGAELAFDLTMVELGTDQDGEKVTSCVVVPAVEGRPAVRRPVLQGAAKVALDLLRKAITDAGERVPASRNVPDMAIGVRVALWREYCNSGQIAGSDDPDTRGKAFRRSAEKLQAAALIGKWGEWVWLPDNRT